MRAPSASSNPATSGERTTFDRTSEPESVAPSAPNGSCALIAPSSGAFAARTRLSRKALRLMKLAERFDRPVIAFIDTPGAYPGIDAEERGQAEAIAVCLEEMAALQVPVISVVIGEGGSGGALALAAGNRVLMLEHSTYSVISPEACASIIWRNADHTQDAAEALKLTAQDLLKLGIIDTIVPEPLGGAHREREPAMAALGDAIEMVLRPLLSMDAASLRTQRREKFLAMGNRGL